MDADRQKVWFNVFALKGVSASAAFTFLTVKTRQVGGARRGRMRLCLVGTLGTVELDSEERESLAEAQGPVRRPARGQA